MHRQSAFAHTARGVKRVVAVASQYGNLIEDALPMRPISAAIGRQTATKEGRFGPGCHAYARLRERG